jgi:outer membrane lipoprotein-sorting protein
MKKVPIIIGIMVLLLVLLSACSNSPATTPAASSSSSSTPTSAGGTSPATTPAATKPAQTSGSDLNSILGKSAGISSVKYDMVTTAPGDIAVNSTMWLKNKKMRMESSQEGQKVVMLIDADAQTMLMYMPDENTAIKMNFGQAPKSAVEDSNDVLKYSPEVIGTETLDGKVCTVIQYNAEGAATKMWVWQDKGLPVRVQVTTPQGTSTTDFKNFDFSDIPDSMFELPAGVQVTDFNLPTGIPTGIPTNIPNMP